MALTEEEVQELQDKIEWEGFDYCFNGYSAWKHIGDDSFHDLLEAMVETKKSFIKYLIENGIDADEF